jgi:hypothetical protein
VYLKGWHGNPHRPSYNGRTDALMGSAKESNEMAAPQEQFIVDAKGRKTGVVLSLRQYRKLMEDLHDLAVIAERRTEKPVAFDELKRRLRKDGLV